MSHRRGSFLEGWHELLERFAHQSTPAALEDQLPQSKAKKRRRPPDVHHELFRRSQTEHQRNGAD